MRYEIDSDNGVNIYDDNEVRFCHQPTYPNGDKFDSVEEATAWAILAVASQDAASPEAPLGKGLAGQPKPTVQERTTMALSRAGIDIEHLKTLLGL